MLQIQCLVLAVGQTPFENTERHEGSTLLFRYVLIQPLYQDGFNLSRVDSVDLRSLLLFLKEHVIYLHFTFVDLISNSKVDGYRFRHPNLDIFVDLVSALAFLTLSSDPMFQAIKQKCDRIDAAETLDLDKVVSRCWIIRKLMLMLLLQEHAVERLVQNVLLLHRLR